VSRPRGIMKCATCGETFGMLVRVADGSYEAAPADYCSAACGAAAPNWRKMQIASRAERKARRTVKPASVVYFLLDVRTGAIKVGRSTAADKRVTALRTGNPGKTVLLGTIPGGAKEEKTVHKSLAGCERHGEWFAVSSDVRAKFEAAIENAERSTLLDQLERSASVLV
jgi:hypothetical protein